MKLWAQVALIALCVAGTVFLAFHGKDGWGWLIFLAILISAG